MLYRNTNQKKLVFDVIDKYGHLTSLQIKDLLKDNKISLATIYRNLTILEKENKIKKLSIGNEDIYESIKAYHYHFICDVCKEITDIPTSLIDINLRKDFSNIKQIEMTLHGICSKCIDKRKED